MSPDPLDVRRDAHGVATVTLNRPDVRNAFDPTLIAALATAAADLGGDDDVRVVVLTGAGSAFSAGADLGWMRAARDWERDRNSADAQQMGAMFRALWDLPKPLIGRINGHAMGGGVGLVACCDVAIATDAARFGFTEVALGLVPAVISPFVVRKVGLSFARRAFTTGTRFDAATALRVGLVHEVVGIDDLDAVVAASIADCLRAGPTAAALAKALPERVAGDLDGAAAAMPALIAEVRASDEAQVGMAAFLDRSPVPWAPEGA